jgi:hypothetical protein
MFAIIAGFPENLFVCFGVSRISPGKTAKVSHDARTGPTGRQQAQMPGHPVNQEKAS